MNVMSSKPNMQKEAFIGGITAVSFSPDGSLLFVGSGTILYVYHALKGMVLGSFEVLMTENIHGIDTISVRDTTFAVVFGQKSLAVFKGVPQNPAEVCPSTSFELLNRFENPPDWIWDARFLLREESSSDEISIPLLAVGFAHNFVEIWDIQSMQRVHYVQCDEKCILYSMAFHGRTMEDLVVASGTVFQQVLLWDPMGDGKPSQRLSGHDGVLFHLKWSDNGRMLLSSSDDRTMQLWFNGSKGESDTAVDLISAFNASGSDIECMYETDVDRSATLHGLPTLPKATLLGTEYSSMCRAWGNTARVWNSAFCKFGIVTVSENMLCKVWNFEGKCMATIRAHNGRNIWKVCVSPDGEWIATGGADGSVNVMNIVKEMSNNAEIEAPHETEVFPFPQDIISSRNESKKVAGIRNVVLDHTGTRAFVVTEKHQVWQLDIATSEWIKIYEDVEGKSFCKVCVNSSAEYVLAGDALGFVYLFSIANRSLISKWKAHSARAILVDFVDGLDLICTSGVDGLLKEWRMDVCSSVKPLVPVLLNTYICPNKSSCALTVVKVERNVARGTPELLCCSDGRGSVFLCVRQNGDSEAGADVARPASFNLRAHGRDQVPCIVVRDGEIYTAGHDGYISIHQIEMVDGSPTLKNVRSQVVTGISALKQLWFSPSSTTTYASSRADLCVFGFHAEDAILNNITANKQMFRVRCGGWRRPHCMLSMNNGPQQHIFLHSLAHPENMLKIHRNIEPKAHLIAERSLHASYHAKLTTCAQFLDENLILTGSEDNSIRLFSWETATTRSLMIHTLPTSIHAITMHDTGIRAMASSWISHRDVQTNSYSTKGSKLIVTAGGKQMIKCFKYDLQSKSIHFLTQHTRSDASQDQRILGLTVFPLDPMDSTEQSLVVDRQLVVCGNSEGLISLLLLNTDKGRFDLLGEFMHTCRPLLCCKHVAVTGPDGSTTFLLFTGSTDGQLSVWDLSFLVNSLRQSTDVLCWDSYAKDIRPIYAFSANQMGLNCLDVTCVQSINVSTGSDSHYKLITVATGGDDQGISCSAFRVQLATKENTSASIEVDESRGGLQYLQNASGSAIKSIYLDERIMFAVGYDQRLNVWRKEGTKPEKYEWVAASRTQVADAAALCVYPSEDGSEYSVIVVGQGMQRISFRM